MQGRGTAPIVHASVRSTPTPGEQFAGAVVERLLSNVGEPACETELADVR